MNTLIPWLISLGCAILMLIAVYKAAKAEVARLEIENQLIEFELALNGAIDRHWRELPKDIVDVLNLYLKPEYQVTRSKFF